MGECISSEGWSAHLEGGPMFAVHFWVLFRPASPFVMTSILDVSLKSLIQGGAGVVAIREEVPHWENECSVLQH